MAYSDDNPNQPQRGTQEESTVDEVIGGKLSPSNDNDNINKLITMLLTDALNGWKW